ncbi:MAG TPA: glucosamine-6-phosphate deaminase, partial [Candidatus Latescibacteria bacterium]|nr:glucosamine-6-phosphate deaminase [Candidatus Latescibacterota bacterium]
MSRKRVEAFTSVVERIFLERSGRRPIYSPTEKIPSIVVENFPTLGRLTALRFIEWVQQNPDGVIALPTGKTPEHFIRWVTYFLRNWDVGSVQKELEVGGVDPSIKPEMRGLHFVQIDEFYPINPQQHNSFYYYVNKFYIKGFGLDKGKALLIDASQIGVPHGMRLEEIFPEDVVDLSLRFRQGANHLERLQKLVIESVDQFCNEYEDKIRAMGGIGFFLGGIGPDGHIGFNVQGSDFYSTTRLTPINYETQAAAAIDLGGIEVARNRLVITIGLSTITYNKEAVAIIIAAGEAKAKIVAQAIEQEKHIRYPATVLQDLPNARFYLTKGAACRLVERRYEDIVGAESLTPERIEQVVIDLALEKGKRIRDLTQMDFQDNRFAAEVLKKTGKSHKDIASDVEKSLLAKTEAGLKNRENEVFMHIGPHHDDIMLGYLAFIIHLVRTPLNKHYFNYAISGFNAVTNRYMLQLLRKLQNFIDTPGFKKLLEESYFDPLNEAGRDRDVYHYLNGVAANSFKMRDEAEARRLLRNLIFLFEEDSLTYLKERIKELINYFQTQYPGKKDIPYIQQLKGMVREWEADVLWGYFGFNSSSVNHLRLGFYKGDIFTEEPKVERDVLPVLNLIEQIHPTVVSVALDPEGSGPDTHYKVLQVVAEALKIYEQNSGRSDIEVWGYRNVWYRFHPSEADIFVPVSLNSLAILESAFMNAFGSQRDASFPSYEYDGPFCQL